MQDEILICQKEDIQYLQFKRLLEYPEIQHCYTLKSGEKLNFLPEHVNKKVLESSKNKICKCLNLEERKFVKPHQTHTDRVEKVIDYEKNFDEVDGLITDKDGITLCTTSADCTSLLFYDPIKKVIGNVHSGWRGTIQKIGQKAVLKMIEEYHCKPEDIICCICPHIRKCHFEVDEDVAHLFEKEFAYMENRKQMIQSGRKVGNVQKYYIDTTWLNIQMLQEIGLQEKNIIDSGICTVCEEKKFYSYRVEKEQSGRNAAIITLKGE